MSEAQVWEHVLKWRLTQNLGLSSDSKSFSKDDFNTFEDHLQQCILFIKFYNFTPNEFYNNVFPYKKNFTKRIT